MQREYYFLLFPNNNAITSEINFPHIIVLLVGNSKPVLFRHKLEGHFPDGKTLLYLSMVLTTITSHYNLEFSGTANNF